MRIAERAALDEPRLRRCLAAVDWPAEARLQLHPLTRSTNDDARSLARAGAAHGSLVIAEQQRAGRGRGGHSWHSPPHKNIYLSLLLRPQLDPAVMAALTLIVGVAVAEVIDTRLPAEAGQARLKWPNDIYLGRRKLGGILVEGSVARASAVSLIVGIGLNVRKQTFPAELVAHAVALEQAGAADVRREPLIADIVQRVLAYAAEFAAGGLAPFLARLRERDALLGERVGHDGKWWQAEGIADDGSLWLQGSAGERHRIHSGSIDWPC